MERLILDVLSAIVLAIAMVAVAWLLVGVLCTVGAWLTEQYQAYRARRYTAMEAELDRKQAELQAAIYCLAAELNADARRAEMALERAAAETLRGRDV